MRQLIILARAPELGQGKRRLAVDLGDTETHAVYLALLQRCAEAASAWDGAVSVHGAGDLNQFDNSALAEFPVVPQAAGNLAERMAAALRQGLRSGPTLLIGSDCPGLKPDHLSDMARLLDEHACVYGPAEDGGYWGIGISDPSLVPICCDPNLPWSTEHLLGASIDALKVHNGDIAFGVKLADCDTLEDLRQAEANGFTYRSS